MIVGAITAATDILIAISLVPMFGIIGAAVSKVAVFLIGSLVSVYLLRNYAKSMDRAQFYIKGADSGIDSIRLHNFAVLLCFV